MARSTVRQRKRSISYRLSYRPQAIIAVKREEIVSPTTNDHHHQRIVSSTTNDHHRKDHLAVKADRLPLPDRIVYTNDHHHHQLIAPNDHHHHHPIVIVRRKEATDHQSFAVNQSPGVCKYTTPSSTTTSNRRIIKSSIIINDDI